MVMSVLHLHEFTSLKSKAALFLKKRSKAGPELSLESVGPNVFVMSEIGMGFDCRLWPA